MSDLNKLIEEYSKQKQEFTKKVSKLFVKELIELGKDVPNLSAIRWHQYTPYFNDGDACTFSVYGTTFQMGEESDFQDVWEMEYNGDKPRKTVPGREKLNEIDKLINKNELEEILESLFGDGVQVTINLQTGEAEVEDYDHD